MLASRFCWNWRLRRPAKGGPRRRACENGRVPIALDATYSVGESLSGVGRYCREILSGLCRAQPEERFLFCYRPHRLRAAWREALPPNAARRPLLGPFPRAKLFHALNQRVDAGRFERTVVTFHDLFVLTSEYSTPGFRRRFAAQAREAARRADRIIAVSPFTGGQVCGLLGVSASIVRVVPHGVHLPESSAPDGSRGNFVLHVGAIQKRKNIVRLVEAFGAMPAGWRLVVAGSASGYGAEEAMAAIHNSPRRADIDVRGYVSDAELNRLYDSARMLAFPSLDEGFGIPVIEAMARGLPVVISDRPALVDLAGDAAAIVPAADTEALGEALASLAANPEARTRLAELGRRRAERYSWERAVRETWSVYEELK